VTILVALAAQILHVALLLAMAPVLTGLIAWIEARLVGRAGTSLLQPWRDLARLLRKQRVVAESASEFRVFAPLVAFAAVATAAAMVPSFTLDMLLAPLSDLLVIVGLLAMARCALALAAMDAGTALGGMGASRTITLASCAEPALLLVIFTLALLAGSSNLHRIATIRQESSAAWRIDDGFALVALLLVALVDTGRGVRRPGERAEFAMLDQAESLEFSGQDLALIEGTAALRLLLWCNLIIVMFLPVGIAPSSAGLTGWLIGVACWLVKLLVLAIVLAALETVIGRTRLPRIPQLLGVAVLFGLVAALFLFASVGII
jgi:formate hydrogenlyase subunit 4